MTSSVGLMAAETDGFTMRYIGIADSIPLVNTEIRSRIRLSINELNQISKVTKKCDWKDLDSKLGERLRRPITGQIESFVNNSKNIPSFKFSFADSIYKALPKLNYVTIFLGTFVGIGFGSQITHNNLLIGADKLGHFFDEGYYYYSAVHYFKYSFDEALDFGILLEDTLDGYWSSGIYSHADLAANYDGYWFWRNSLGVPGVQDSSKYFHCRDGLWHIKKEVDLADYINEAWDEGMNCNEFRNDEMKMAVDSQIKELELSRKKRLACPVFPDRIDKMIKRYGESAKKIINPKIIRK